MLPRMKTPELLEERPTGEELDSYGDGSKYYVSTAKSLQRPEDEQLKKRIREQLVQWNKSDCLIAIDDGDDENLMSHGEGISCKECGRILEEMSRDPFEIRRALLARKFDVEEAYELIRGNAIFRAAIEPRMLNLKEECPNIYDSGSLRVHGHSKCGQPICFLDIGLWDPSKAELKESELFNIYHLELATALANLTGAKKSVILIIERKENRKRTTINYDYDEENVMKYVQQQVVTTEMCT